MEERPVLSELSSNIGNSNLAFGSKSDLEDGVNEYIMQTKNSDRKKKKRRGRSDSIVIPSSDHKCDPKDSDTDSKDTVVSCGKKKEKKKREVSNAIVTLSSNSECDLNGSDNDSNYTVVSRGKKKKRRSELSNAIVVQSSNSECELTDSDTDSKDVSSGKKKKKKRKKKKKELSNAIVIPSPNSECDQKNSDTVVSSGKKKKKKREELSNEIVLPPPNSEYDLKDPETVVSSGKKKKKKREELSNEIVLPPPNSEYDLKDPETVVSSGKKKKKKREDVSELNLNLSSDLSDLKYNVVLETTKNNYESKDINIDGDHSMIMEEQRTDSSSRLSTGAESDSSVELINEKVNTVGEISRFRQVYTGNNTKHKLLLDWSVTNTSLREAGVTFASGKWTKKELDILHDNVERYKEDYSICDFEQFYKDVKEKRITCEKIYEELGQNIFRQLRGIKNRLDLIYLSEEGVDRDDDHRRFTVSEIEQLISLQKKHGNNWSLIGKLMGRSKRRLSFKFSKVHRMVTGQNTECLDLVGDVTKRFSQDDDKKLRTAIETFGRFENDLLKEINWNTVANFVGGRSAKSCYQRWVLYVAKPYYVSRRTKREIFLRAVKIMYDSEIQDINEVDWITMVQSLKLKIDHHRLRKLWWAQIEILRQSPEEVPNYKTEFRKLLCHILDKHSVYDAFLRDNPPLIEEYMEEDILDM